MADGHRGVAMFLLEHELGHGLAHDVAAAQYHALLARSGDIVALQQGDDAQRSCRDETGQTQRHATGIHRVYAVNVLSVVDSVDDMLLIDVLGQRQLHDEAIHVIILIQFLDAIQQLLLGCVFVHSDE